MTDPLLTPMLATDNAHTLEEVREALMTVPLGGTYRYDCPECGAQCNSATEALACEQQDLDMRPRD